MSTEKHTPGPLAVSRNLGVILGGAGSWKYKIDNNSVYTALVGTKADAVLYAAAPALLKTLTDMLAWARREGLNMSGHPQSGWNECQRAGRAIALATGESPD